MKATVAIVLIAFAPPSGRAQNSLADALRKGIVEEDVNHNLDAAIREYRSVVAGYDETRQTAATALFRLAECYRKQGKTKEANAAYTRVVSEFADQTRLVEASRRQLGGSVPQQAPSNSVEARRRYRQALEEKLALAQQQLAATSRQLDLGAGSALDSLDAQFGVLRAERELTAFDAGLAGPQAPGASTSPTAMRARAQLRNLIEQELGVATQALAAEEKRVQMGVVSTQELNRRKLAVIELQSELAALDAGSRK
jgi:hypothetical protein